MIRSPSWLGGGGGNGKCSRINRGHSSVRDSNMVAKGLGITHPDEILSPSCSFLFLCMGVTSKLWVNNFLSANRNFESHISVASGSFT